MLLVRNDAEEMPSFLAGKEVEVVALDDRLAVSRLERSVTERAIGGDMVGDEAVPGLIVGDLEIGKPKSNAASGFSTTRLVKPICLEKLMALTGRHQRPALR
jgi:hypothetical protein